MENVYGIFNGKITKFMPSLTSQVFEGVTLICHNSAVTTAEAKYINTLFKAIGEFKIIDEQELMWGQKLLVVHLHLYLEYEWNY